MRGWDYPIRATTLRVIGVALVGCAVHAYRLSPAVQKTGSVGVKDDSCRYAFHFTRRQIASANAPEYSCVLLHDSLSFQAGSMLVRPAGIVCERAGKGNRGALSVGELVPAGVSGFSQGQCPVSRRRSTLPLALRAPIAANSFLLPAT